MISGAAEPPGISLATDAGRVADNETASLTRSASPVPLMLMVPKLLEMPRTATLKLNEAVVTGAAAEAVAAVVCTWRRPGPRGRTVGEPSCGPNAQGGDQSHRCHPLHPVLHNTHPAHPDEIPPKSPTLPSNGAQHRRVTGPGFGSVSTPSRRRQGDRPSGYLAYPWSYGSGCCVPRWGRTALTRAGLIVPMLVRQNWRGSKGAPWRHISLASVDARSSSTARRSTVDSTRTAGSSGRVIAPRTAGLVLTARVRSCS